MPTINLNVSEEFNERRNKLQLTWRELIAAGLEAREANTVSLEAIRTHARTAVVALSELVKLIPPQKE